MGRHRPSPALVVALAALVVAIGGTAVAAIGAIPSNGQFTACYQTSANLIDRIVVLAEPGEQCPNTYARVTWPAQASGGAQGPAGPAGPQGPPGPPGEPAATNALVASLVTREAKTDGSPVIVRCGGIGKRRYAVGGGGAILSDGTYRVTASYPVADAKGRPNGWAVSVMKGSRYTIKVPGVQTTSRTIGGAFAGPHTHQYDPGPRLLPLDGPPEKPATVRVYAICARLG
jgi:hypothetical protein